jgi:hypothetical protein
MRIGIGEAMTKWPRQIGSFRKVVSEWLYDGIPDAGFN